jgi:ATP-dependent helicase/nuclease subunit B
MILSKLKIDKVDLDLLINSKVESDRIDELLLIVPTNRKARTLKKEIISLMPRKSAPGMHVETIGTLSSKLLGIIKPFRQLSEAAATVFIKQSASEIKLEYFTLYKKDIPFGTLDRIKNIITEYKRHGITPESLKHEAEKLDKSEKLKALDIANIYENYLSKCLKLNAFEIGDVYKGLNNLTNDQFYESFYKIYSDVDLIIVNGFDEFSIPEQFILNKLADINRTSLFINFDYNQKNKLIFSHLDKCFDKFGELGFNLVRDITEERLTQFRKTIRDKLFLIAEKNKKLDYTDRIIKMPAFSREEEVEQISKEIKKLIAEKNVEPSNICLVFNLIQNYRSIVHDIFTKNGIPFNLTDRIALDNSNPVTAVVNFLEIAENDFYYKNIFRALSSGFIDKLDIDFANLVKVSSELKIVSGKENWISTLTDSIENIKYDSDEEEEGKNEKSSAYQKALDDINTIARLTIPFEAKLTIPDFLDKLIEFTYKTKLPFKLLSVSQDAEENIRGFSTFIETLTEVFDLLTDEHGKDKKFNLHFFMDQIRTACGWERFNVKEKSNYGVQITTLEEIRGLQFDYLFIGGMCDGDLPTRYKPEIFYSPSFKKQAYIHQTEERNLFYQVLLTWNKKLYLSYPQTDGGRETVVSTYLNDFEELFKISSITDGEYNELICSKEEIEVEIGKVSFEQIESEVKRPCDEVGLNLSQIEKAIQIEKLREIDPLAVSSFTGHLFTDKKSDYNKAADFLLSFSNRQYSISQLETYAKCPFKFFIERILKIDAIEEPTEDIEAIEMGNILHNILFQFYSKIRKLNIKIDSADQTSIQKVRSILDEIAQEQIAKAPFKSPLTFYEKEKIFGIGGNEKESILNRFVEYESENNKEFIPGYFEVRFGSLKEESSDEILSDAEPIKVDGIKLKGKIDRIDLSIENDTFNVVDYKLSGKKPSLRELKEGISLQLPVYLYAASGLLNKKYRKDFSPNEMIIYSLKYSSDEFGKLRVSSSDKEIATIEQLINLTIEHIRKYISQISEGRFGLSPHEDREKIVCRYCRFKSVCRISDAAG